MVTESNGLNLSLGLTLTHSAVLPTHTEPRPTRETRSAASAVRLPESQSWLRGEPARLTERKTPPRVFFFFFFSPESKPRLSVCLPSVKKRDFFFCSGGEKRTEVKDAARELERQRGAVGDGCTAAVKRLHFCWTNSFLITFSSCVKRRRTGGEETRFKVQRAELRHHKPSTTTTTKKAALLSDPPDLDEHRPLF